jgi:hypothetical protein
LELHLGQQMGFHWERKMELHLVIHWDCHLVKSLVSH